jgi:hypothetical protein
MEALTSKPRLAHARPFLQRAASVAIHRRGPVALAFSLSVSVFMLIVLAGWSVSSDLEAEALARYGQITLELRHNDANAWQSGILLICPLH